VRITSRILSALPHTKLARLVTITVVVIALTATASATVFTFYYGTSTSTIKTPDVQLVAGPDATGGSVYPSANVTIAATYDYATVAISLFPSATDTPQPETYFTNLVQIKNAGSSSHTIDAISVSGISSTHPADFGNVTVFYETTQTNTPTTNGAVGYLKITSTTGGNVFSGTQSIGAGATQYLEITGWAGSSATIGDKIIFTLSIQWV